MFQYPQTKICPRGQNVSIPPFCILIICLNNQKDINKKGFYIRPSLIFRTFRSTRDTSLSFTKSSCCSIKAFNLHCFQRRNCQTRHAIRHFSEQERFFDKIRKWEFSDTFKIVLMKTKDCVTQWTRVCSEHLFQFWGKRMGNFLLWMHACVFILKVSLWVAWLS